MWRSAFLLLFLLPLAAQASPKDELVKTQAALKASRIAQEKLERQQQKLEKELTDLQKKLVRAAAMVQKNDAALDQAERKLQQLSHDVVQKEKDFSAKRQKLDGLSRIAIRLSRTPPQAMVLMPTDGRNRLQAANALARITADIKMQAKEIQRDMAALEILKTQMEEDKRQAEKMRDAHQEEKKTFEIALKARKMLRDKLSASKTQEENKSAELAKKASSLKDFINALNNEEDTTSRAVGKKEVVSTGGVVGSRGAMRLFENARGRIRIPVSGRVVLGYGDRDGSDSSKGLKIATSGGATVVAPFDAEVAYSGTFLHYGRLVILKHHSAPGRDFHTLLSGLSQIDVKAGDFLLEGEPIGAMSGKENQQLYVELRENNQPVNPKQWMRGL